jgi:uncharacterized DUF497 family protein
MLVRFDPRKNLRSIAERGIPFESAERIDWSAAWVVEDLRRDYGERRFQALGMRRPPSRLGLHAEGRSRPRHQLAQGQCKGGQEI